MEPIAQRKAIADACGWRLHAMGRLVDTGEGLFDPLIDLNVMHDAEKVLSSGRWDLWIEKLRQVVCDDADEPINTELSTVYNIIRATAPQRAKAFLLTIGKWTED